MNELTRNEGNALPAQVTLDALTRAPFSLVISNAQMEDCPIVYVNSAFEDVTGYSSDQVVGRNCRFLQGEDTDPKTVAKLRTAIAEKTSASVDIRNYRADGSAFWNRLMISPISSESGDSPYFMGIQIDLGATQDPGALLAKIENIDSQLEEVQHRVKNHLSMVVGMIRIQARESEAKSEFKTLARRIEALQLLYEELKGSEHSDRRNDEAINLGAYVNRVANAIAHLDGRAGVRIQITTEAVSVPFETATRIGLAVSEVVTNALQHAFIGRDEGIVNVELKELSNDVLRIRIADDGVGLPDDVDWPQEGSLGSKIVSQLITGLDAKLGVERDVTGTIVTLDIPNGGEETE